MTGDPYAARAAINGGADVADALDEHDCVIVCGDAAETVHTRECRTVRKVDTDDKIVSEARFSDLGECTYCSGEYEPTGSGAFAGKALEDMDPDEVAL